MFGQHVERQCREAADQVVEEWQANERRRHETARGRKIKPTPAPRQRATDASESKWHEIVRLVKRRRLAGRLKPSKGGMPRPTAVLTWEKPLTGDPLKDASWDDAKIVHEERLE